MPSTGYHSGYRVPDAPSTGNTERRVPDAPSTGGTLSVCYAEYRPRRVPTTPSTGNTERRVYRLRPSTGYARVPRLRVLLFFGLQFLSHSLPLFPYSDLPDTLATAHYWSCVSRITNGKGGFRHYSYPQSAPDRPTRRTLYSGAPRPRAA